MTWPLTIEAQVARGAAFCQCILILALVLLFVWVIALPSALASAQGSIRLMVSFLPFDLAFRLLVDIGFGPVTLLVKD